MTLGKVYLVGAGPGDPGLLTLKGLRCLGQADLILYDGLVNPLLLRHTRAQAERTCRSSASDGRMLKQDEVNRRLIEAARAGKTVVRLKGGDPFIFGRGSEEALALAEAGIPFEVVPGVTAAIAAGDYAGMSFTHRELASAVAFVTGHEDPAKTESALDYQALAKFPGTLVFYMGLHHLEFIAESLVESGMDPQTPAAVVCRATWPAQQTVTAALKDLPAAVRQADLHAPSLIVIGSCVLQRERIAWFENRPLFGRRIGITRPEEQAGPAIDRAWELGAQPVLLPTIRILPPENWDAVDRTIDRLGDFDWLIFTSANGVRGLLDRMWKTGRDVRKLAGLKLAAIGSATAETLTEYHLRADLVPGEFRAEALAETLKPQVADCRVLWARASRGRDVLPNELQAAGATVEQIIVYQNVDVEALPLAELELIETGRLDWIGLSSPSIARSLKKLLTPAALEQIGKTVRLASISPVTSAAAGEAGLPIAAEAQTYTWDGIFAAIMAAEAL
jgi:uroporphyrinogen III methyltransferase / synthase